MNIPMTSPFCVVIKYLEAPAYVHGRQLSLEDLSITTELLSRRFFGDVTSQNHGNFLDFHGVL